MLHILDEQLPADSSYAASVAMVGTICKHHKCSSIADIHANQIAKESNFQSNNIISNSII